MSVLRVELVNEFKDGAAILVSMDSEGLAAVRSTLKEAASGSGESSTLEHNGTTLAVVVGEGPSTVDLHGDSVVWHLSHARLIEVIEKLDALAVSDSPCHHYVDISAPVDTLVLSKDEYL